MTFGQRMKALYNFLTNRRIRLSQWLSLIFFAGIFAGSCRQKEAAISIVFNGKQATGISISPTLFIGNADSAVAYIQVRLVGSNTDMLGSYKAANNHIEFTPLIPLMPGGIYEVLFKNNIIGTVKIPAADAGTAAQVISIFPATDTVPLNLLKIYIRFSAPMQEGQALQHVSLLDEKNDTVPGVFLDLQPELWDVNRTTLTLWLDPGRIKRDLIPNQKMGNPLQEGKRYAVAIANSWKDAQGLPLHQSFTQTVTKGLRDSISPKPEKWKLQLPKPNTNEALTIHFGEALDYFLLQETITIKDLQSNIVLGKNNISNNGNSYSFSPEKPWQPGRYILQVASLLEDLAGNNINRLFERDLKTQQSKTETDFFEREFVIR